jgi:hypothetical protein
MQTKSKAISTLAAAAFSITLLAGDVSAAMYKHHSKAKGALVGAVAGGVVAGKKGAVAGAATGALVQHHRNKKSRAK